MRSDRGTANPAGDGCGVPRYGEGTVVSTPITAAERHKRMPARGHAASLVLGAARIEAEEADDWRDSSLADGYRAQALAPLSGEMIVHGAGGELVPTDIGKGAAEWRLLDTVDNPNYVTADASRGRLDLAQQAGALEEALDAADTIEARDSLERMLAHQLATVHVSAMKMSADLNRQHSSHPPCQCSRPIDVHLPTRAPHGSAPSLGRQANRRRPARPCERRRASCRRWQGRRPEGPGASCEGCDRGPSRQMTKEPYARILRRRLELANAAPRCG